VVRVVVVTATPMQIQTELLLLMVVQGTLLLLKFLHLHLHLLLPLHFLMFLNPFIACSIRLNSSGCACNPPTPIALCLQGWHGQLNPNSTGI
jgi:hypothetical protein